MKTALPPPFAALALAVLTACAGHGRNPVAAPLTASKEPLAMTTASQIPSPASLTPAPLRNRMRVLLKAPVAEVWTLVGDMSRLPEYSGGLERVEMKRDIKGHPTEYTCYFKPMEKGGPTLAHGNRVRWYQPNLGWASRDDEPNDFGLSNSVHIVTVQAATEGTLVRWEAYYDAADLSYNRNGLDQAFADIGERLVARFGGRMLERHTDARPGNPRAEAEAEVIQAVEAMTAAFHRADLDAVMTAYEAEATVAFEPGKPVSGATALREGFRMFFGFKPRFTYGGHEVLQVGDSALHFAPWTMNGVGPDGKAMSSSGLSVALLRRNSQGQWKLVIDNPYGGRLLATG